MPFTEAEKDEVFLRYSGYPRELWERYKRETDNGAHQASDAIQTEMLEFALRRDRAVNPNLSAYTFLTPEKRAELTAKYAKPV
jgi:hypothetical protein